jgi:hypothetical protein
MSDELVKRLRSPINAMRPTLSDGRAAADRIEELEAKLAKALDGLHEAENAPEPDRHVPEFRHVMDIIGFILAELKRKPS